MYTIGEVAKLVGVSIHYVTMKKRIIEDMDATVEFLMSDNKVRINKYNYCIETPFLFLYDFLLINIKKSCISPHLFNLPRKHYKKKTAENGSQIFNSCTR
ncbi:hypothetical protein SAMN05444673_3152 [Bacillus sp. OV166]|nr:hypothetical protein SAMN05444673_3152 [Bacillus sp. OV166]